MLCCALQLFSSTLFVCMCWCSGFHSHLTVLNRWIAEPFAACTHSERITVDQDMVDNWKLLFPLFHAFYRSVISIPTHSFRNANQNSFFFLLSPSVLPILYMRLLLSRQSKCVAPQFVFYFTLYTNCVLLLTFSLYSPFFFFCAAPLIPRRVLSYCRHSVPFH